MKKILLLLVALVFASPAMATVTITLSHVDDTNEVIIGFTNDDVDNLVRAFGLNVTLDNDSNIVSAEGLSTDYWVYPGTIVIAADGEITDSGTIAAEYDDLPSDTLPGPPDSNGVTLECASLYAPVGPGSPNAPVQSGDLAKIIINGTDCQLCVTANVSRAGAKGVVMEDPAVDPTVVFACVDVNLPDEAPPECMKTTAPEYSQWETWGKPKCWCYSRHCRGDATGTALGPYWVQLADLDVLKSGWYKVDTVLATVPNGICGDFNHAALGPYRVQLADLNVLKAYWYKVETLVPECEDTNYNFWETP